MWLGIGIPIVHRRNDSPATIRGLTMKKKQTIITVWTVRTDSAEEVFATRSDALEFIRHHMGRDIPVELNPRKKQVFVAGQEMTDAFVAGACFSRISDHPNDGRYAERHQWTYGSAVVG